MKKIAALETELASRNGHGTYNEGYAEGFKDAMHRFQIRNKTFRSRIYERILANGPGEVKRIRGSMF